MGTDFTIAGACMAILIGLVGGAVWSIRKLLGLGAWLSAINRNTTANEKVAHEISDLKHIIQRLDDRISDNTVRIEDLERQRRDRIR